MNTIASDHQELIPAIGTKAQRNLPFALDDAYVKHYIQNPAAGKTAAIIKAGFTGTYPTQRANELHRRLQNKIDMALTEALDEGILIGMFGLKELAINATSENIKAAACSKLVEFGFKHLPTRNNKPTRTRKDIQKDIQATMARIEGIRENPLA